VTAREGTQIAEIRFPAEDGKMLAEIYRGANVLSQKTDDGQIVLRARLDEQLAGRLTRSGATIAYSR
jgi:GTPase